MACHSSLEQISGDSAGQPIGRPRQAWVWTRPAWATRQVNAGLKRLWGSSHPPFFCARCSWPFSYQTRLARSKAALRDAAESTIQGRRHLDIFSTLRLKKDGASVRVVMAVSPGSANRRNRSTDPLLSFLLWICSTRLAVRFRAFAIFWTIAVPR